MFGFFGLQKLIVLAVIILAVWYGFKYVERLNQAKKGDAKVADKSKAKTKPFGAKRPVADEPEIEEMVSCETCGDFVSAGGATACGRENCPYPG